jgi:hypothetical protein
MALASAQPLAEMRARSLPRGKGPLVLKAGNLIAICVPIFQEMCELQSLTTVWASTSYSKSSFTCTFTLRDLRLRVYLTLISILLLSAVNLSIFYNLSYLYVTFVYPGIVEPDNYHLFFEYRHLFVFCYKQTKTNSVA